ncbi:MAG: hypothetical protein MASP_00188 [Candidatus Methanolliviera sp. GoM_asphalt]|nr:MAG: hypothetical protein MASP_00188 [Candidatus Methanolliviera sp. GoM_asphalt]
MTKIVTDANVIAKWYINGEIEILAPELLPFEALNALRYADLFHISEFH